MLAMIVMMLVHDYGHSYGTISKDYGTATIAMIQ